MHLQDALIHGLQRSTTGYAYTKKRLIIDLSPTLSLQSLKMNTAPRHVTLWFLWWWWCRCTCLTLLFAMHRLVCEKCPDDSKTWAWRAAAEDTGLTCRSTVRDWNAKSCETMFTVISVLSVQSKGMRHVREVRRPRRIIGLCVAFKGYDFRTDSVRGGRLWGLRGLRWESRLGNCEKGRKSPLPSNKN